MPSKSKPATAGRGADEVMTHAETAAYVRLPESTLYQLNYKGSGPLRIRVGRYVRYRRRDVDAWLDAHTIDGRGGDRA